MIVHNEGSQLIHDESDVLTYLPKVVLALPNKHVN